MSSWLCLVLSNSWVSLLCIPLPCLLKARHSLLSVLKIISDFIGEMIIPFYLFATVDAVLAEDRSAAGGHPDSG